MLTRNQRSFLFLLFCLFAIACASTEIYLVYSVIREGSDGGKALVALLNGGVLFGCGRLFLEMVRHNFLKLRILTPKRLHDYAAARSSTLENAGAQASEFVLRRSLVTSTLEFAETCLKGWVPGSHIELCVFVDPTQPLMFAYFDSNQKKDARSMSQRELNPQFYLQQNYEVTRILQKPTSQPRFIDDTHDKDSHYAFASNEQRNQVKSSILLCLDLKFPCALVVSSDAKRAFSQNDSELVSFIRFIGEAVHSDLLEGGFISNMRSLRPELFPPQINV